MAGRYPKSTAAMMGHPLHPALIPFPIGLFVSALITDILYVVTENPEWTYGSFWLIVGGLVGALLAALAGLTDFLGDRRIRAIRSAWLHMIGNVTAVVIEVVNVAIRWGDNVTMVVKPTGLILSILVGLILTVTGWLGGELVFRHGVGVHEDVPPL